MQDFISKESETSVFIEAKAVALIYCLIKKNDIFHLSEMKKQELHYPPPLCFAMQNIGEVSRSDGGVGKYRQWRWRKSGLLSLCSSQM